MKKNTLKILSLLLAVLLLAGIFPVSAVATEGTENSTPEEVTAEVHAQDLPANETASVPGTPEADGILNPTGPEGGENAPAPGSANENSGSDAGNSGGPDSEDSSDQQESSKDRISVKYSQNKSGKLELAFTLNEDEYTLKTVKKVLPENLVVTARNWGEKEEELYRMGHSDLHVTQDDVLAVSFRDEKNKPVAFENLVEFTLTCSAWKGSRLDDLRALEYALYLTSKDDDLGEAQIEFHVMDDVPVLCFSTNRLADLLLMVPNAAEKERRRQEAEEKEQEERKETAGDVAGQSGDPADQSGEPSVKTHTWSDWTVVTEATCTEDGSRVRACTDEGCDATETEVIPAAGHTWDTDDEFAAATCTVCGETREASYPIELDGDHWRQRGDPDAAENAEYWSALFGGVVQTGNPRTDLLTVAVSQIGYRENKENYLENPEGETRNYSRYGAWAGQPYGSWNAAFACFCLNYAGIPEEAMPRETDASRWVQTLLERGLFRQAGEYQPRQGELLFYTDPDTGAASVGIIWQVDAGEGVVTTIEGAVNHAVDTSLVVLSHETVIGFGVLPESGAPVEEADHETAMPAQNFNQTVEDMTVTVVAPVGAFPANTRMELAIVEDEEVLNAAAEAVLNVGGEAAEDPQAEAAEESAVPSYSSSMEKKVSKIRAVDITFFDAAGNEVEPAVPVRVTMKSTLMDAEKQSDVVHIDESGAAKVGSTEKQDDAVSFDTDGFSTYVMVETETITTSFTSGDGLTYEITVRCGTEEGFPEGWNLSVSELTEENESYQDLVDKTTDAVSLQLTGLTYVKFLDISLLDAEGTKVEPEAPMQVSVRLMDRETGSEDDSEMTTAVVHFADGAEVGALVEGVSSEDGVVTFTAESFSAYAIVEGPAAIHPGWLRVSSLSELKALAGEGLYISADNWYLTNETAAHSSGSSSVAGLFGIKRSATSRSYPTDDAVLYYFEEVEGQSNQFYIYCHDSDKNKLYATYDTGAAGVPYSIFLTSDETRKTPCTVTVSGSGATAYWRIRFNNDANLRWYRRDNIFDAQNSDKNFYFWKYDGGETYKLDGKSYGLMYWVDGIMGKGLMSDSNATSGHLNGLPLTVMSKPNNGAKLYVPDESDLSFWTFHLIDEDYYYLTSVVDGSTRYLRIGTAAEGLSMVSTPDDSCRIRVIPGSGSNAGKICLQAGNRTLAYSGDIDSGFQIGGTAGNEWLNLVEESELTNDYFMTCSAQKVSVSDESITNGSRIIVYTRVWNEKTLKYEFYAIDQDGSLVRCYESGDSIEWVGGRLNSMLWNFVEYYWEGTTDPNFYYDLYNQYSEKFIAPQASDGQILSDDPLGINLNGRRNGQYYSTIVAWDEGYYAYVGLKADMTAGKIVSCPVSEAGDFYFAVIQDLPVDDELTTVPTVDHTQYGITMKMVNFGTDIYPGNNDTNVRGQMSAFLGSDNAFHQYNAEAGLLNTALGEDGYPVSKASNSLSGWFAGRPEVNHLFIASTYYGTGYYEYDSVQNFAHLDPVTNTFVVYKELGSDSVSGDTHKHGLFWPYNDIEAGKFSVNKNTTAITSAALPETDPRKYETMYMVQKSNTQYAPDYYFGMEVTATFTQTPNGLDNWGHDIIYEFTGDDDFWLFVDGELIIDLGGIHSAISGDVNYRTGVVHVNGVTTSLRELFRSNYVARGVPEVEIETRLAEIFTEGGIFKDYTTHTMKIYYLERGAGSSNLHMRFNLASIKPGTAQLTKKLSGIDTSETVLAEFPYRILYRTRNKETGAVTELALTNHLPKNPQQMKDYVFYKDSAVPVTYKPSFSVAGLTYSDVFILKPDETADINFPVNDLPEGEEFVDYRVIECGVNTDVFSPVKANDVALTGSDTTVANRKDYGIDYAVTDTRARVVYDNAVSPDALRTLTVKKHLFDVTGETELTEDDDKSTFDFRLYLATETADIDASPANMHTYHVKDQNGVYCYWDVGNQRITPLESGKTVYSALTPEELLAATFHTSPNGSITRIPVGYTVEVRDVLAGTKFKLVERPSEIPDGYSFWKYRYNGTEYMDASAGVTDTVTAEADPHADVCNIKGFGLRINKVWTDADYMSERDATYYAVYYQNGESLQLVEDSVRQMAYGTNTVYWYYDALPVTGIAFDQYFLYEVKLTGTPVVDVAGRVTDYDTITPLDDGDSIELSGKQVGEERSSKFTYTVSYERGEVKPAGGNVREDTVTNSRPGIRIQKSDWAGTKLPGAAFRLDLGETEIGEYTSDANGLVTVACLIEGRDYTLTELSSPQGYHGLESAMPVRITQTGALVIDGTEYTVDAQGQVTPAVEESAYYTVGVGEDGSWILTVKNKLYGFRVLKKDKGTDAPMSDVQFKLYREIIVDGAHAFDPNPYPGFDNLRTDADGMLQLIPYSNKYLIAGKYELRETTPAGYAALSRHPQFTVSATGAVKAEVLPEDASFGAEEQADGSLLYTLTIENRLVPRQLTVKKVWEDADNQDGIRPDQVRVQLYADGKVSGDAVTLKKENNWAYTWEDIPKYHAGTTTEIVYSVDEVKTGVITGTDGPGTYAFAVTGDMAEGFTVTNTHTPVKTTVTVTKVWSDSNNQDGIRPSSVQVQLKANGADKGEPVTLDMGNSWKYTWENLLKYAGSTTAITYTVEEVTTAIITGTDGPGTYAYEVTGDAAKGFTVTNTHTPEKTEASVKKVWDDANNQDGIRPTSVEVVLAGNDGNTYKVTMNGEEEPAPTGTEPAGYEYEAWKAKFVNLPKYHEGTLITYACTETETSVITGTDGPGTYAYTVTGNATAGFTVTNTHTPETTTATVTKVWDDADNQDGIRPETLTLTLNGAPEGTTVPASAVTKKGNSWTYTWSGLPKYENGTEIRYTVTENSVPAGYTVSGSPAQNGGTITNTHTPTPPPPPPPPGPPGGPPVVPPDEIDDDDVPLAGFGTVNQVGDCYE